MMMSGQLEDLKRRHCGDIYSEISDKHELGLDRFFGFVETREKEIECLKNYEVSEPKFGELVVGMHRQGVIANANINRIVQEYDTPRFDDFSDRTAWSFQNACTEVFKGISNPVQRLDSQKSINELLRNTTPIDIG